MSAVTEYIAGTPIRLKAPYDFSFLHQYGEVFRVVENYEGSGNLCFGVKKDGAKYFVKFAGAPKEKYDFASTDDAVQWLKEAQKVYEDLRHDSLIRLVRAEETGGGFAAVFEWTDSECIGTTYPQSREKFLRLPVETRRIAFQDILDFHAHVAEKGYVAIDFYSDQILYDFETGKTTICDIDFYQRAPYYGDKGQWGSANFVSPEECVSGSRLDEITLVYTMGATAFAIFADHNRDFKSWEYTEPLYAVAKKAVSDDRDLRQQSVSHFIEEWNRNLPK